MPRSEPRVPLATFLAAVVFTSYGAHASATSASLSPAAFHRLAVAAIASYEKITSETGTSGLQDELERCYPKAIRNRDQALVASCVLQDQFATQVEAGLFPNAPQGYFSRDAFAARAVAAISATVPEERVHDFIASLSDSEDAAAHQHFIEVKAKKRAGEMVLGVANDADH